MGWLSDQDPEAFERQEEQRVAQYEETLVKRILRYANVPFRVASLRREARQTTNEDGITFDFFHEKYPSFPVHLGAAKLKWTHMLTVGDLFGAHFMRLPCCQAYMDLCHKTDLDPRNDRIALIFNWAGIDAGGAAMALHNYPVDSVPDDPDVRMERGTRLVRPFGQPLVIYVIESFSDFLLSVGTDWYVE